MLTYFMGLRWLQSMIFGFFSNHGWVPLIQFSGRDIMRYVTKNEFVNGRFNSFPFFFFFRLTLYDMNTIYLNSSKLPSYLKHKNNIYTWSLLVFVNQACNHFENTVFKLGAKLTNTVYSMYTFQVVFTLSILPRGSRQKL